MTSQPESRPIWTPWILVITTPPIVAIGFAVFCSSLTGNHATLISMILTGLVTFAVGFTSFHYIVGDLHKPEERTSSHALPLVMLAVAGALFGITLELITVVPPRPGALAVAEWAAFILSIASFVAAFFARS